MVSDENFVSLHTHSDFSTLDGCARMEDYIKIANERGHKAIAFTEHGTMRGFYQLLLDSNKYNIKPIYGVELYVCSDMSKKGLTQDEKDRIFRDKNFNNKEKKEAFRNYEARRGIRGNWHMTAWAKNVDGLKNLFKITSKAWIDGFYYKPRADLKLLVEHGDGIILGTACCGGMFSELIRCGCKKQATMAADLLYDRFGDDFWLEIMPHNLSEQVETNRFMLECQRRWGKKIRLLATQDAHYLYEDDWKHHEVLLAIGTHSVMSDPDRFRFSDKGFHFKTRKEMADTFAKHHSYIDKKMIDFALNNTVVLADNVDCEIEIDKFKCLLPSANMPQKYNGDSYKYMMDLCKKGWSWRDIPGRARKISKKDGVDAFIVLDKYLNRLKMELKAINRQKFVDYFLIVHELYDWIRKQGIVCGPGRGSAAGSLVSYLLGITSVDPIEHRLLFERFINPGRIDMPDIDCDFEDSRRQEVIDHLREKYGHENVCQIATIGKLSGKQCLKDVGRVLEVPFAETNKITSSIIERAKGDERVHNTIEDSFKEFRICKEYNKKYPLVLHHSKRLEGLSKNLGIHAAGVLCSPILLTDLIPLETRNRSSNEPIVVSAIDMHGAQAVGLLKLDILGLRTMAVFGDTLKAIKRRHDIKINLEHLDLNDPEILQGFTDHEYTGIFQFDTPVADKACSGIEFTCFDDIVTMTALNRPGTARSGLAEQYVARKKNPDLVKKSMYHPKVDEITSESLGVIVFQEHVIKIFTDVAGFDSETADLLRKKIGKSEGGEALGKERERFIQGACKNTKGMTPKIASKLMNAITQFGFYAFNRSHSAAYSMISYQGMWLKIKYPLEFFWALLKNEPNRIKLQQIAKDARKHGVEIFSPEVNISKMGFTIDDGANAIRGSLIDIKNVGENAAISIMEQQPFKDFNDFMERINRRKVNKRVITSLAKAGALDSLLPNSKWFVEEIEGGSSWEQISKSLGESIDKPKWTDEEKALVASKVSPLAFGQHPIDIYSDFIDRSIKVSIADTSDENFFNDYHNNGCFILGIITKIKHGQVGDHHTGPLPDERERVKMGWGRKYANVYIEDVGGKQNRIKIDWDIFDDYIEIINSDIGTPVILHATANATYENLRAHFLVDFEKFRQRVEQGHKLNIWECILIGEHPVVTRKWQTKAKKRMAMVSYKNVVKEASKLYKQVGEASFVVTGVVTHVKEKYDKNMHKMGFFGVIGVDGYLDVICFASSWIDFAAHIKPGRLLSLRLSRERGSNFLHSDHGKIWILDSSV